ncbi:SIR2 family protein [Acinetobacter variabilis]|uniref:DUF4917 family protein n=1 Tax=Acinetobacter variabilis TaxID=70346 RepID=UPI0030FC5DE0
MSRKLLIFGNGLGMAIDHNHYSLTNALNTVWNDTSMWTDIQHRGLIQNCIPTGGCPNSEDELDKLHLVSTSCEFLKAFPDTANNIHWLSPYGKDFTKAVQEYVHTVASYLFSSANQLPVVFKDELVKFLKRTNSHVATLNYDQLLYNAFVEEEVCADYSGNLVDGFWKSNGFHASHLERMGDNDFGYYMHLHGSPLFRDTIHGWTVKLDRSDFNLSTIFKSKHLVLTHIKHKPSVITASYVLSTYWRYLTFALTEVEEVILFGYSGLDKHLNDLLKMHSKTKVFKVIEWDDPSATMKQRQNFWDGELGQNVKLQRMADITQFTTW